MTRPDLVFSYSQLSKFVKYPGLRQVGMVLLEAAYRVLQYVRAAYDQGITFYDLGQIKEMNWADQMGR